VLILIISHELRKTGNQVTNTFKILPGNP